MNYYEHFLGDYTKKTGHLRMAAHGAYRMLLDHYYSTERALPAAYVDLYVICKAIERAEQATVRAVADEFFPIGADGLRHNERADEELPRAQKRIRASRENGKGGGRSPRPDNPAGNPPGSPTETQQHTQQEPDSNPIGHIGEAFPHAPCSIPSGGEGRELPRTEAPPLPGTLTAATWAAWRSHLANLRKPMTPQAERLQLVRLAGHADPEAVVQHAIANGHRVLEPVGGWPDKKRTSVHDARMDVADAIFKRGKYADGGGAERDISGVAERVD